MEEMLYKIDIHRDKDVYLGKIYSDVDGVKEFKNNGIDKLLRDITLDIQLALDTFSDRTSDFSENKGQEFSVEKSL